MQMDPPLTESTSVVARRGHRIEGITNGNKDALRVQKCSLSSSWWWFHGKHINQNISIKYFRYVQCFYVNYASIKLFLQ